MRILQVVKVEYMELRRWRVRELIGTFWKPIANFSRESDARLFARAAQNESLKKGE